MAKTNYLSNFYNRMFSCSPSIPQEKKKLFHQMNIDSEVSEVENGTGLDSIEITGSNVKMAKNLNKQNIEDDFISEENTIRLINTLNEEKTKNIQREKEEVDFQKKTSKSKNKSLNNEKKENRKKTKETMKIINLIDKKKPKIEKEKKNPVKLKHSKDLILEKKLRSLKIKGKNELSLDEYVNLDKNCDSSIEEIEIENEVSCVIDFYDKAYFNEILSKKMEKYLKKKK